MSTRNEFASQTCSGWASIGGVTRQNQHMRGCENMNPNFGAIGKSNPRLSSKSSNSQPLCINPSLRGGALSDITNVAGSQGIQMDRAKLAKQFELPLQPPVAPFAMQGAGVCQGELVDVQAVKEYAPDILRQLFREETAILPRADYMELQTDISATMRTILIDWLIEVHSKYRLCAETLHLTVNLIDRYLSRIPVTRKKLQLVGVTALFIASKFEDVRPPELHEMVYITDNAYNKEDVQFMECTMLTTLGFKIMVPTAAHFFEILQEINGCDAMHREVAQYLLELGLLDIRMLQNIPSHIAAAALMLSNELLNRTPVWTNEMAQQSRNSRQSLQVCVADLRQLLEADRAGAGGQLQAVHKKFSLVGHHSVAKMKF